MANSKEAVIAGSKSFALALLAPLTERVGTRPRIAADPTQAVALTGGEGLVVVEFQGDRSLEAIRRVRDEAAGLAVIAAVPAGNATAEEALRSLGVESARWDGRPDDVLAAVTRHLGGPAAAAAPPTAAVPPPAPPAPSAPAAAPAVAPLAAAAPAAAGAPRAASDVGALFDDVELDADEAGGAPIDAAAFAAAPPVPAPAPADAAPGADWPATVPGAEVAADALTMGISGVFPPEGSPLAVVAEVMTGMSPLERAVLLGEPQAVDPAPVRDAAVMRLRVAVALATAPQAGTPVDVGAVSALLGEIDALLTKVNALVAAAPPDLQPSLEQVRNAVVKEAIDFSEAAHRAQPAEAEIAPPAGIATAAARRAAQTRMVSVASKDEAELEAARDGRQRWLYAVLAVAVLATAAYHGYGFLNARRVELPNAVPGLSNAVGSDTPQGGRIVHRQGGGQFDAAELKRFADDEALKGNSVLDMGGGNLLVLPRGAAPVAPRPPVQDASAPGGGAQEAAR